MVRRMRTWLAGALILTACSSGADDGDEAADTVAVRLLAINDLHGNLEPPDEEEPVGGVEYLATHLGKLGSQRPDTFVVSAGDNIGASPLLSALFADEPTIAALDLLGLDASAVGNHEFDEGPAELVRRAGTGRFPYLAANVTREATGERLFPPHRIVTVDGVRVAFVGATLEGAGAVVVASGTAGLRFSDEADAVNALVPELRAGGVEAVVVLIHEGGDTTGEGDCPGLSGPIVDIATRLDDAVDVVVSGHTNRSYVCDIDGKLVTSTSSFGEEVTVIDLDVDRRTGDVKNVRGRQHRVDHEVARDPGMTALLDRYRPRVAELAARRVGAISAALTRAANPAGESALGDVVADAQLAATGAQVAFVNPGGIRADLAGGILTYAQVFATQPFPDQLVTMTLDGTQVLALLERQWEGRDGDDVILAVSEGFSYAWRAGAAPGRRVEAASVTLAGVAVRPEASYRVTVNSFLAGGGDGFEVLTEGTDVQGGPSALDALETYLAAHDPLAVPPSGRVRRRG